jgi:acetoin utilization deacetylase AcuC-like enzyme
MRKLTMKEMMAVSGGQVMCADGRFTNNYSNCPTPGHHAPTPTPGQVCASKGGTLGIYGYCFVNGRSV